MIISKEPLFRHFVHKIDMFHIFYFVASFFHTVLELHKGVLCNFVLFNMYLKKIEVAEILGKFHKCSLCLILL